MPLYRATSGWNQLTFNAADPHLAWVKAKRLFPNGELSHIEEVPMRQMWGSPRSWVYYPSERKQASARYWSQTTPEMHVWKRVLRHFVGKLGERLERYKRAAARRKQEAEARFLARKCMMLPDAPEAEADDLSGDWEDGFSQVVFDQASRLCGVVNPFLQIQVTEGNRI